MHNRIDETIDWTENLGNINFDSNSMRLWHRSSRLFVVLFAYDETKSVDLLLLLWRTLFSLDKIYFCSRLSVFWSTSILFKASHGTARCVTAAVWVAHGGAQDAVSCASDATAHQMSVTCQKSILTEVFGAEGKSLCFLKAEMDCWS